jgi:four helix bundle protein
VVNVGSLTFFDRNALIDLKMVLIAAPTHLAAPGIDDSTALFQRVQPPGFRRYCGLRVQRYSSCLQPRSVQSNESFRGLKVWQASMELVEAVYRASGEFPSTERFGLTAQLRRACVSIPSNIGEGKRRKRQKAFLYHLDVALGSQAEVDVQLEIAKRLGYLKNAEYERLQEGVAEVGRMLNGLIESMQPREPEEPELPN